MSDTRCMLWHEELDGLADIDDHTCEKTARLNAFLASGDPEVL